MILEKIITIKSVICYIESRSTTYEKNITTLKKKKEQIENEINRIVGIGNQEIELINLKNSEIRRKKQECKSFCNDFKYHKLYFDNNDNGFGKINNSFLTKTKKNIDEVLEKYSSFVDSADDYIKKNTNTKNKVDDIMSKTLESLNALKDKTNMIIQYQLEMQNYERKKTKLIYDKLCELNLDFIHYKDFDKLDYIYYYIETNRADNIKDALNLVDNQLRHEELVGVLNEAITTICNTISRSASIICDVICEYGTKLCMEINDGVKLLREDNEQILRELSENNINISAVNDNLDTIVDNQKIANALLKNQSKSCEDMLKHYRYVNGMSGDIS